jgi:DNA invertase Pin-like site-specific DNA recombinase
MTQLLSHKKSNPLQHTEKDIVFGTWLSPEKAPKQARRTNDRLRDKPRAHLIGYMRVSKADGSQVLDLQRDALLSAGVSDRHLYNDTASGKKDDRPGLASCLQALREGDTLVIWKLDRLGRNLRHLVNVVHDLTSQGVGLKVLSGQGAAIDTTTPAGKLVFGIFASLAEFERDLISERTRAGLASARARGRKGGRRPKMTLAKLRLAMAAMGKPETNVGDLCRELGITRSTLYRHISPAGEPRGMQRGSSRADDDRHLAP